jgi:hypothetical protein
VGYLGIARFAVMGDGVGSELMKDGVGSELNPLSTNAYVDLR